MPSYKGRVRKFGDNVDTDSVAPGFSLHLPLEEMSCRLFPHLQGLLQKLAAGRRDRRRQELRLRFQPRAGDLRGKGSGHRLCGLRIHGADLSAQLHCPWNLPRTGPRGGSPSKKEILSRSI